MTVYDRAAKTYKTLNDAGRSHDECLRAAVDAVTEEVAKAADKRSPKIRALSNGGQRND